MVRPRLPIAGLCGERNGFTRGHNFDGSPLVGNALKSRPIILSSWSCLMLLTEGLTKPQGEAVAEIQAMTVPGMAHWAGGGAARKDLSRVLSLGERKKIQAFQRRPNASALPSILQAFICLERPRDPSRYCGLSAFYPGCESPARRPEQPGI